MAAERARFDALASAANKSGQQLMDVRQNIQKLWHNQQEMLSSINAQDGQFACILRMFQAKTNETIAVINALAFETVSLFRRYNGLVEIVNDKVLAGLGEEDAAKLAKPAPDFEPPSVEPVTYAWINRVLIEFDALKRLPNFENYIDKWYMGVPLATIMDEAEAKAKEEEARAIAAAEAARVRREAQAEEMEDFSESPTADPDGGTIEEAAAGHPEGAQIFGGDEGGSHVNGEEVGPAEEAAEASAEEDEVPGVQGSDDAEDRPQDSPSDAGVSEVRA